ncbi:MAG: hypothetical protein IPM18_17200 [Phycisphaerales bacterium]|nr:hypothetical protein [Phycisphaerales bacterium]
MGPHPPTTVYRLVIRHPDYDAFVVAPLFTNAKCAIAAVATTVLCEAALGPIVSVVLQRGIARAEARGSYHWAPVERWDRAVVTRILEQVSAPLSEGCVVRMQRAVTQEKQPLVATVVGRSNHEVSTASFALAAPSKDLSATATRHAARHLGNTPHPVNNTRARATRSGHPAIFPATTSAAQPLRSASQRIADGLVTTPPATAATSPMRRASEPLGSSATDPTAIGSVVTTTVEPRAATSVVVLPDPALHPGPRRRHRTYVVLAAGLLMLAWAGMAMALSGGRLLDLVRSPGDGSGTVTSVPFESVTLEDAPAAPVGEPSNGRAGISPPTRLNPGTLQLEPAYRN